MRDLEPYVCLIEHCPDPEHFFRDRGTWFSHMRTHSTEWRCSLLNHSLSFKCEDDYDKHMRDEHSSQFTVKQLDKLRMRSRHERPGSSPFASCPLCSWDPSMGHSGKAPVPKPHGFTNVCSTVTEHSRLLLEHIANHLQFLALYCLTAQDDVDEVLSSDEPSLRRAKSSTLRTSDTHLSGWVDEDIGVSESSHPTDPHMDIFEEPAAIPIADMTSADDWNFVYQSRAAYTGHENDAKLQNFIRKAKMEALLAEGKTADPILPCRSIPLQRNPGFFGRETILYKMETALCPGERLPGSTSTQKGVNSLILQGEGGVGKTQIAVEFAYSNRDSFDVVLWAHADEPSKLARDFNRMAIKLGLVSENSAEARDHLFTRDLLKAWLMQPLKSYETPGKAEGASWLLIFDHVIWPDVLNDYWPIGGSTGSILITTRRTMPWSTVKYPVCPIEPFPEEEAAAFLKKEVKQRGCSHDEEHARLLARRVNGFPHELSLLSRIIVNNNNSLCQFLKEYDKKQSQREILRLNVQDLAASVRDDFFSGWALEVLDAKSAALLDVLSMLDPDAVPEELLAATPKHIYIENYPDSRPSYEETRNILLSNSLVSRDRATGNLIQHRLIQDATRRQMDRDRIRLVFNACVQLINAVWPWQEFTFRHSIRRWPKCELLFPHIIRLRKWGKQIDAQISDLSGAYEYARLLSDAGW
jgi:hypothetical protein